MKDLRNRSLIEDFFDMKYFNELKPFLTINVLLISLVGVLLYLYPIHQSLFSYPALVCSIGIECAIVMVSRVYFNKSLVFNFWHCCATVPIAYVVLFAIDFLLKSHGIN